MEATASKDNEEQPLHASSSLEASPPEEPDEEPPVVLLAWGAPFAQARAFWIFLLASSVGQGILFGFVGLAVFLGFTGLQNVSWNQGAYRTALEDFDAAAIRQSLALGNGEWWYVGTLTTGGVAVGLIKALWTFWIRPFPAHPANFLTDVQNLSSDEPWEALPIAACAIVSIGCGASCGPEMPLDALVSAIGGVALPALLNKVQPSNHVLTMHQSKLCGMDALAAAFGPLLPSQYLGPLLIYELGQPLWTLRKYDFHFMEIITRMAVASTISYAVFVGIKERTILHSIPPPEAAYDAIDDSLIYFLHAIILGLICGVMGTFAFTLQAVFGVIGGKIQAGIDRIGLGQIHEEIVSGPKRTYLGMILTPTIGGCLVGLLTVACPLILGDGSAQLAVILNGANDLGATTLILSALAKLLALSISLGFGFIGGNVFPYLFAGACIGSAAHVLVPEIPILVSFAVGMAASSSSCFPLIFTFTSFVSMAMALGGFATSPVFIGAVVSYFVGPGLGFSQWLVNKGRNGKTEGSKKAEDERATR